MLHLKNLVRPALLTLLGAGCIALGTTAASAAGHTAFGSAGHNVPVATHARHYHQQQRPQARTRAYRQQRQPAYRGQRNARFASRARRAHHNQYAYRAPQHRAPSRWARSGHQYRR